MAAMLIGLALMLIACAAAAALIRGLGGLPVNVRAATTEEAPDKQVVERTVVAEPHGATSVLPALTATLTRLAGAVLGAAVGAALAVWGLCAVLAARHESDALEDYAAHGDATRE